MSLFVDVGEANPIISSLTSALLYPYQQGCLSQQNIKKEATPIRLFVSLTTLKVVKLSLFSWQKA